MAIITSRNLRCWLAALAALAVLPGVAAAADSAATVYMLVGHAVAQNPDGSVRTLTRGATVASGETVSTDSGSYVNLQFADGGYFLLRPLTRFQIEQFTLSADDAAKVPGAVAAADRPSIAPMQPSRQARAPSRAIFRLLRGGFRAVSGLIGKAQASEYQVNTPVATIGIRGTDYLAALCSVQCAGDPAMAGIPADALNGESMVVGTIAGEIAVGPGGKNPAALSAGKYGLLTAAGKFYPLPFKPEFIAADPYLGTDAKSPESCK